MGPAVEDAARQEVVVTLSDSDRGGGVGLALGSVAGESTELVSDSTTRGEGAALGTVARGGVDAGLVVGVAKAARELAPSAVAAGAGIGTVLARAAHSSRGGGMGGLAGSRWSTAR